MARHHLSGILTLFILLVPESAMAEWLHKPKCDIVFVSFPYCLEFLTGLYHKPSPKCCNHIKKLNTVAKQSIANVRRLCTCIEGMVKGLKPPLSAARIQQLPNKCSTHLSFPISESMDCSKV